MALKNILDTVCEKYGFDATSQRALLLQIINRAAKEVYEIDDLPGCLREITCLVPPNSQIALPYYVGQLRAMREYYSKGRVELKEMAPRYSYNPWPEMWRVWRVLKKSPLCQAIQNAATSLTLTIGETEAADVNITVTGSTLTATRTSEVVTILTGELSADTATFFTDVISITKEATNENDIVVTGRNTGNTADIHLATIPNDRLEALYTVVDVSELPGTGEQGTPYRYIDVLYKEPLPQLFNDGDTFPCEGFDDAIVYKVLEHQYSEKADGGDKAIGFYEKCNQIIYQRTIHSNGATQKEIVFAPNQYFDIFPRYPKRIWHGGVLR